MGLSISRETFTDKDFELFGQRLDHNLTALQTLLSRPGFGDFGDQRKIGCEVEFYLMDDRGRPAKFNQEIQQALGDPQITLELNRFNLEFNSAPIALQAQPITSTAAAIQNAIESIDLHAKPLGCSVLPIGILPTALEQDFGYHAMTDLPRYHALTRELCSIRGGPFQVHIEGQDELDISMEDVTLEGANTSLQVHYQVRPDEFASTYNALQLVTPLIVAASANSPIVFGRRLWHETRIPLFKQAIDCRPFDPAHPQPARVNFGHAWVHAGALEIFTEAVRLYRPLLPICSDEDALAEVAKGTVPSLEELRLQQGSVWLWNRPVYDPAGDGHLRIEARTLPAGPTVADMMANVVLTLGLMELLRTEVQVLLPALPFEYCERNFYRAAQLGLSAEINWPDAKQNQPLYRTCSDVLNQLLPMLPQALERIGLAQDQYAPSLAIIEQRIGTGQTGAVWQLRAYESFQRRMPKAQALQMMVLAYQRNSNSNLPVGQWVIPD